MSNSNRVLPVATVAMALSAAVASWRIEARELAPAASPPSTSAPSTSPPSTSPPSTSAPSTSAPSTSPPSASALSTSAAAPGSPARVPAPLPLPAPAGAYSPRHPMSFSGFLRSVFGAADASPPVAGAPARPAPAAVRSVDVAALRADLASGAVPLLVDVRSPGEYGGGHVPGAKNIPLDQLGARLAELGPPEREVYVICQSGARSARAGGQLAEKGFHPVNVSGGTGAWRAAGYPVE